MRNVNAFCPTFTLYPLPALNASPYSADYRLRCTVLHSEFLRSTRAQREALGRAAIALSDADRCRYVWEGEGEEKEGEQSGCSEVVSLRVAERADSRSLYDPFASIPHI